jgi:hypothetical protein
MLYSAMIDPSWDRGNYLGRVEVSRYTPRTTLRLKLECTERCHLQTRIGIAGDVNAQSPEHEIRPQVLNGWPLFKGSNPGAVPMGGPGLDKPIELGVDLSELTTRLKADADGKVRLFIHLGRKEKSKATGVLHACAIRHYDAKGGLIQEVPVEITEGAFGEDELVIAAPIALAKSES